MAEVKYYTHREAAEKFTKLLEGSLGAASSGSWVERLAIAAHDVVAKYPDTIPSLSVADDSVPQSTNGYYRLEELATHEGAAVRILHWKDGIQTPIHSHEHLQPIEGNQPQLKCQLIPLNGTMVETLFERKDEATAVATSAHLLSDKGVVRQDDSTENNLYIHAITIAGENTASLHTYSAQPNTPPKGKRFTDATPDITKKFVELALQKQPSCRDI